jgi:hypothetical protein
VWPATAVALAVGAGTAAAYYVQDLTLSHYDSKAHLVVARRIVDSMRPGWMQIGAVWLPLPHLLNAVPVQNDLFYRTGLSAVAFSVIGFVMGAGALWKLVRDATGASVAGWAAFAVFAAQPDVLYLQSTPMTEPLLMGLCLLGIAMTWRWIENGGTTRPWGPGTVLAMACLTRYEAWPIAASAMLFAAIAFSRIGVGIKRTLSNVARLAGLPVTSVLAFMILSRLTVGRWLVTGGFFDVDQSTYRRPLVVLELVWIGFRQVNGELMTAIGLVACVIVLTSIVRSRRHSPLLVVFSLAACVTLPLYAFWNGHPFRVRYVVPPTMALAAITGIAVGLVPRYRLPAATAIILTALLEIPPLSSRSPMIIEAQRDAHNVLGRQQLTACFLQTYDHTPILASMASLAPYMQETARVGLSVRQYIHEGIGDLWTDSLGHAGRHARWILIEEHAEGGDVLARLARSSTAFLDGFERSCEGGGVALYRRVDGSAVDSQ